MIIIIKLYNLCKEKIYVANSFYKQGYFPFKDHEATSLNLIRPFCEDLKIILDEDKDYIIVILRKEGKGRKGIFICCLLLYFNYFEAAEEFFYITALWEFEILKDVTIPI